MRTKFIVLLVSLLLAGCAGQAQAPTPTLDPPTATVLPSATPIPATATATNTATPVPPTATKVPPTATPKPTNTATPGPGDVVYHTDFNNFTGWRAFPLQTNGKLLTEIQGGQLDVKIQSRDTYAYILNISQSNSSSDMAVETLAQRGNGTNRNNVTVVCRASEKGWYEFTITSGGLYNIIRFDADPINWTLLASGGSAAIQMQDKPNKITAICQGDTLTLVVNDQTLATANDSRYLYGTGFGLSVSTFDIGNVTVDFDYVTVSLP